MMKGWVIFRALRSESSEWPIRMVRGWKRLSSLVWISDKVVVTPSRDLAVIPE